MKKIALATLVTILPPLFSANSVTAQVSSTYVNVLCVWHPYMQGDYVIQVYRQPGQTLVHSITNPAITAAACTADANDLLTWVKTDLDNSGTLVGGNDQLDTHTDVFCPGPNNPISIHSLMANMSHNTQSGAPQAGLVVNYSCPGSGGNTGGGTTPPTPDVTYNPNVCDDASNQVVTRFDTPNAIMMTNLGSSPNNTSQNAWQINIAGITSSPTSTSNISANNTHCDQALVNEVQDYLQTNIHTLDPTDFGVDIWSCPTDQLVANVTQCNVNGNNSTYGYRIDCCPPEPITTTRSTMHTVCFDENPQTTTMSLAYTTQFLAPPTPVYSNPATVCQDAETDALNWYDTNLPSGIPPCFASWGAAAGGSYVPSTFRFLWCQLITAPQCFSNQAVQWRQEYQCTP